MRSRPRQRQRNPNLAKLGDLKRLFAVLDRASRRKFNLYITEYGYETNPPDTKNGVSMEQQNRYLQESAYVVWATKRVKLFSQYLWRDDNELNGFQTGLIGNDGAPKPSLASFPHPFFIYVEGAQEGRDLGPGAPGRGRLGARAAAARWRGVHAVPHARPGPSAATSARVAAFRATRTTASSTSVQA